MLCVYSEIIILCSKIVPSLNILNINKCGFKDKKKLNYNRNTLQHLR